MLKDLDQDNPVTPAEKPTFRKSRASRKPTRCCDMCTCTCPTMALNSSALKPIQKPNVNVNKEQKPKICPRLLRHSKTIETTTDNSANVVGGNRGGGVGVDIKMPDNSGVELVPLLARRRAFERPISLSTTDVTKRTASNDRYASKLNLNMNNNHNNNHNNINNINNHNHNRNNLRNLNNSNIKNTNCTNTTTTTCCLKKFTLHIR